MAVLKVFDGSDFVEIPGSLTASVAHTIASHSDTTATGAELETLTDGSTVAGLHVHAASEITSGTLAHERGGLEFDASGVVAGDLIIGTGAGSMGLVPGDIGCRAYGDAAVTCTTSTFTAMALNQERWDTDGIHSLSVNNSRLTPQTAGKYAINGHITIASNSTGTRFIRLRINGATSIASIRFTPLAATSASISATYIFNGSTDYVELIAWQDSGGDLDVLVTANFSPELSVQLDART